MVGTEKVGRVMKKMASSINLNGEDDPTCCQPVRKGGSDVDDAMPDVLLVARLAVSQASRRTFAIESVEDVRGDERDCQWRRG